MTLPVLRRSLCEASLLALSLTVVSTVQAKTAPSETSQEKTSGPMRLAALDSSAAATPQTAPPETSPAAQETTSSVDENAPVEAEPTADSPPPSDGSKTAAPPAEPSAGPQPNAAPQPSTSPAATGQTPSAQNSPKGSLPPTGATSAEEQEEPLKPSASVDLKPAPSESPEKPKFGTLLLIEGFAKYGGIVRGDNIQDDETRSNVENFRAGNFGGQGTLALLPGQGTFTMAGRLRAGSYVGKDVTFGNLGAAMLFGINFGKSNDGRKFSYLLGGLGVDFIPSESQDMLMLHLAAGTVMNGISLSGGLDLGGNDEFGAAMIGMQIGWGQLY